MSASRYRLERPLAIGGIAELFHGMVRGAEDLVK